MPTSAFLELTDIIDGYRHQIYELNASYELLFHIPMKAFSIISRTKMA